MINNLYYNSDDAPSWGLEIDDDLLASALASIYNRDYNPRKEIDPDLFRGVVDRLDEAITEGIADDEPDAAFVDALRHSAEVFAAFKVHKAQNDMAARLLDSNGHLKSFEQWSNDVQSIASHQFGPWLRTEYDTAVIRAHQAAEWQRFERDKDVLPNLRWAPSTSPNPGADHRIYWGTILPVDHPFWSRHRPGDRWNCQCSLESTDEPATGIKREDAVDPRKDGPHKGLGDNPGKSGSLFGQDHPYYPDSCSSCPFAGSLKNRLGMRFSNKKKDCNNCRQAGNAIPDEEVERRKRNRVKYRELKNNPEWSDVEYDKRTGGLRAQHVGHIIHDSPKAERFFEGFTSTQLELECQAELFRIGHVALLLDESKKKNGNKLAALDLELDGEAMDIRSITGHGWYSHALAAKNRQLTNYNAREDVERPSNSVCLYFHDPSLFDHKKMVKSIEQFRYYRDKHGNLLDRKIKHVYCVIKGSKELLKYDV